ncbi:TIGR01459 family HAD-type hydrolase [Profundibacterium mesophilum]|uniref:4-nitrophenyl phosphatase n=1 Tax=Profundibacterium mesophilum KAUST100406-0324 TaxID=1037889 RepID=A0A921TCK6_9RHOB|nr:TIGR01459 family HAD-type hydrolase [Profundibacterium mesophilum]KAF0675778.1 4-nitrophenyl phosphatase [Profundibacterium mesophilum KAUST100406-0324]
MNRIIESLGEISQNYDALFCDLWGCLHDGRRAFPEAVEALRAFRADGGTVVLLTNAPRPRASVETQIARFGIPEDCWDTIATSGDSARAAMFRGAVGARVWFMGQSFDEPFFSPMKMIADPVPVERVALEEAEGIVCTGPFDPLQPPEALLPQLRAAQARGLPLLNANPDLMVDRGEVREWCGGAVAALYAQIGGTVLSFGKPHPPVYALARERLGEIGRDMAQDRILAVGDGIVTDIAGAAQDGIDSLFVTGGLAAAETRTGRQPDPEALRGFLDEQGAAPEYSIGKLR